MKKSAIMILLLGFLITAIFSTSAYARILSLDLEELAGEYLVDSEIAWENNTFLGLEYDFNFGEPIETVMGLQFEFWGEVTFPTYMGPDGGISESNILFSVGWGLTLEKTSYSREDYPDDPFQSSYYDYVLQPDASFYARYIHNTAMPLPGLPTGEGSIGMIFLLDQNPFPWELIDAGEVNVTDARLTLSTETALTNYPVPEASTLILIGSGVVALVGFRWKRKKEH